MKTTDEPLLIALADDHAILRKGLAGLIDHFPGMKLLLDASNGQELIDKIAQSKHLPDICVLDINMPVLNGYDTARALRLRWPDIRILALSMYDNEFNIIKMLRSGASGYVLKDAEPGELQKALQEINQNGFYHSELVTGRLLRMLQNEHNELKQELNERELQFLKLCCSELTYKEIASRMNLSPRTIDGYRDNLFARLNITNRTGLVIYAIKTGICTEV